MTYREDHPVPGGCLHQVVGLLICAAIGAALVWLAHHYHLLGF